MKNWIWLLWFLFAITLLLMAAGCSTPRGQNVSHITPSVIPQPSFTIVKIRDGLHEVPKEDRNPHVVKCYVLEVRADGGVWRLVIDQSNRVIFKRFSRL